MTPQKRPNPIPLKIDPTQFIPQQNNQLRQQNISPRNPYPQQIKHHNPNINVWTQPVNQPILKPTPISKSTNHTYIHQQKKPKYNSAKPLNNNQLFNIEQDELYEFIFPEQNFIKLYFWKTLNFRYT